MSNGDDTTKEFPLRERGRALRRFRKQAGMTMKEVARRCGLSEAKISLYETGKQDLSRAAFDRLNEVITDVLSDEKAARKLAQLRESAAAQKLVPTIPPEDLGRMTSLAFLGSPQAMKASSELYERIRLLEKMNEGYRKLHAIDEQIIALLSESGPGSAAAQGVKVLDEVKRLRAENAQLREWLNAEEVAAVAHGKATELREKVNKLTVAGMKEDNESDE